MAEKQLPAVSELRKEKARIRAELAPKVKALWLEGHSLSKIARLLSPEGRVYSGQYILKILREAVPGYPNHPSKPAPPPKKLGRLAHLK